MQQLCWISSFSLKLLRRIFYSYQAISFSLLQVGLAVDDIKGVQEKAVLKRLAMQVYVLRSEPVISSTAIMYRAILFDVIVKYCHISIRLCFDIDR